MGHATAYLKTRAWIEVDLKALEANWLLLKAKARGEVIPVLKAEAYGHGALPLARFLFQKGARWVAVATVSGWPARLAVALPPATRAHCSSWLVTNTFSELTSLRS
jgi:hypothetical protein